MEYTTETYKGDGVTVIIKRPILTPEERTKREKEVRDALVGAYYELYYKDPDAAQMFVHKDYRRYQNKKG